MSDATRNQSTGRGFGRVLVALYGVMAIAATARSLVQIIRDFSAAPTAYSLSVFAAIVYIIATFALARGDRTSRRVAVIAITVELVGVIAVGLVSLLVPEQFPKATVWSHFGQGYLFLPLVLPIVGLWWLHRTRPVSAPDPA